MRSVPVFNRVWDTPNNGYAEKFKHSIEPFLSFRRTSAFDDFDRIITLDSIDGIVGGTTTYTYGVNNRIYAKRRIGEISQAQQIVSVELSAVLLHQTARVPLRPQLLDELHAALRDAADQFLSNPPEHRASRRRLQ